MKRFPQPSIVSLCCGELIFCMCGHAFNRICNNYRIERVAFR